MVFAGRVGKVRKIDIANWQVMPSTRQDGGLGFVTTKAGPKTLALAEEFGRAPIGSPRVSGAGRSQ